MFIQTKSKYSYICTVVVQGREQARKQKEYSTCFFVGQSSIPSFTIVAVAPTTTTREREREI
jgi:hypothetical protein